ncbi:MAG: hypothetical protein ACI90V_003330, partial [Bacillariaceae sp.]
ILAHDTIQHNYFDTTPTVYHATNYLYKYPTKTTSPTLIPIFSYRGINQLRGTLYSSFSFRILENYSTIITKHIT